MKMYLPVILGILSFTACTDNETSSQSVSGNLEKIIENAESQQRIDPKASGDNKCLLDYQTRYDQLLAEEDIIAATGFSKDVMQTKYQKVMKNPEYHEVVYKFKNKRIGKIPELDMEMELPDVVAIRAIKPMSLAQFKGSYRAATDEEMELAKNEINKAVDGKSNNKEVDQAMDELNKKGIDKKTVKGTANIITDKIKEVSRGNREVEGLGDAANWNVVTNELTVVQNGVQFQILANLSNDPERNKSVALGLAKKVIEKCK